MSTEIFLSFILASLILGLIPGPSVCFTIAQGLRFGIKGTLPSIAGQMAANAVQLSIVYVGLSKILEHSISLFYVLKITGGLYLLYIGIRQFFAKKPSMDEFEGVKNRKKFRKFLDGFIICGTNPKAIIFFTAFMPQFISINHNYTFQFVILGITNIFVCWNVLFMYTLLSGKARHWLINKNYWKIQNKLTGSLLIGAGLSLAFLQKK